MLINREMNKDVADIYNGIFTIRKEQKWLSWKLSQSEVYLVSRNRKLVNLSTMTSTQAFSLPIP